MHIARAYCVDAGKIVDIYQARALFFAQHEPRRRFEFLCSDDLCRASDATKVTGVNYDKLVEEGDCFVQKPHFRANAESLHIAACDWVARERALLRLDSANVDTQPRSPHRGFRRLKSDDLVAIFWPEPAVAPGPLDTEANVAAGPPTNRAMEISATRKRAGWRTRCIVRESIFSSR